MSSHNLLSQLNEIDFGAGTTEWFLGGAYNANGKQIAGGNTVPADGATGYATGCFFIKNDGGNATAAYVNEGTVTSSDFNALSVTA